MGKMGFVVGLRRPIRVCAILPEPQSAQIKRVDKCVEYPYRVVAGDQIIQHDAARAGKSLFDRHGRIAGGVRQRLGFGEQGVRAKWGVFSQSDVWMYAVPTFRRHMRTSFVGRFLFIFIIFNDLLYPFFRYFK